MQDFTSDLRLAINAIKDNVGFDAAKPTARQRRCKELVTSVEALTAYSTNDVFSLSELAQAYNRDLTQQAQADIKSVVKLALDIADRGVLQPLLIGRTATAEYLVSGRHRLLAMAALAHLTLSTQGLTQEEFAQAFNSTDIDVAIADYASDAVLSELIIGANDSRRVRPTERAQMKLAQNGVASLEDVRTKLNATNFKNIISLEVAAAYEGDLTPTTVYKLTSKVLTEFKMHPALRQPKEYTEADRMRFTQLVSFLSGFYEENTEAWFRDYGNVARSIPSIEVAYHSDLAILLDELVGRVTVDEDAAQPQVSDSEVETIEQGDEFETEDTIVEYDVVVL